MTLHEFSRDIVPIIATVISALSLILLLLGLRSLQLLEKQIEVAARSARESMIWNRNNAHHVFFSNTPNPEKDKALVREMKRLNLDPDGPITNEHLEVIKGDVEFILAMRHYLNELEELCAAVNAGTVDEELAYALDSSIVTRRFFQYEKYIDYMREKRADKTLYVELQHVATKWAERSHRERVATENKLQQLEEESTRIKSVITSGTRVKPVIKGHE
ncbi:MAG TPA: DUF4760 domain-containing protein [Opitutaceae bacterium]|nr:DUF4760 domain-containing protein [Opitutaceae bacterium]